MHLGTVRPTPNPSHAWEGSKKDERIGGHPKPLQGYSPALPFTLKLNTFYSRRERIWIGLY